MSGQSHYGDVALGVEAALPAGARRRSLTQRLSIWLGALLQHWL